MILMRTTRETVTAVMFELEEIQALKTVQTAMENLVHKIGEDNTLMSAETGEIIGMAELMRMAGILEALQNYRCYTILNERFGGISE